MESPLRDDAYSGGGGVDGLSVDFDRSQTTLTQDLAGSHFLATPDGTVSLYNFSRIHFGDQSVELNGKQYEQTYLDETGDVDNYRGDGGGGNLWIYRGGDDAYSGGGGVDGLSVDFDHSQTTLTQNSDNNCSLVTPNGDIALDEIEWIHFKDQSLDLLNFEPTSYVNALVSGFGIYKLLKNSQEITLRNSRCRTFSDRSSRIWDITQASATETGFQVLLEGQRGRRRGRYQVWSADASGVITDQSRWMTGDQMLTGGYEDVFNRDFNNDGFVAVDNSSLV